jgi:rod shape determining protein RodA
MATRLGYFTTATKVEKSAWDFFDWQLFLSAVLLCAVGLVSIYSATYLAGMADFFYKQVAFMGLGIIVALAVMYVPQRWLEIVVYPLYGFSLLMLAAVLIVGKTVYGSKSWIALGPVNFQPSELAKIASLFMLGKFIARTNVNLRTLRDASIVLAILSVPVGLIMLEPDFGSATVFGAIFLGISLWCGVDIMLLFGLVTPPIMALISLTGSSIPFYIALVVVSGISFVFRRGMVITLIIIILNIGAGFVAPAVYEKLPKHHQARIQTLFDPDLDPRGKGYNVIQSKMAIGSGGLTGKGFMQGTQTQLRYIPKQWTDFIFCVPTEEFGFIGGGLVLGMLTVLIMRTITIAAMTRSQFESVIAIGIGTIWLYHTVANVGMVLGLFPVIGIPLPFMSAGGSSLVMNMFMLGLLLNIYRRQQTRLDYQ